MIRAGFVIDNPLTNSRTTIIEGGSETAGSGWLIEVVTAPKAGPDIAEHLHLDWTETFEIISGQAFYQLDGVRGTLNAGESFVVKPRQRHIHPWNAGSEPMVYRQRNQFGQPTPGAVEAVLGVFATTAALAREGKVDASGRPKHPLQLAATLRTLNAYGGYDASIPIGVQNLLSATLGRLANRLGFFGSYEQHLR